MKEENRTLVNYLRDVTAYGSSPEKMVVPEKGEDEGIDKIAERNEELSLDEVFPMLTHEGINEIREALRGEQNDG